MQTLTLDSCLIGEVFLTNKFKVSGSAETPRGRDFVGTGSLFKIGDKIEKKVYNYTTESIVEFESAQDFGSITTILEL